MYWFTFKRANKYCQQTVQTNSVAVDSSFTLITHAQIIKPGADPERCKYYKWQKKDNFKLSNEKLINLHVTFNKNINIADLIMFMFCLECFVSYFFGCIFSIRTFFN